MCPLRTISLVPGLPADWVKFEQQLFELTQRLLDREADKCAAVAAAIAKDCPWPLDGLEPENAFKQLLTYYVYERVDPATGKTPLRTFVEKEVEDPRLREAMLAQEHPAWNEFVVTAKGDGWVRAKERETGESRLVRTTSNLTDLIRVETLVGGFTVPWGPHRKFAGITSFHLPDPLFNPVGITDLFMQSYEAGQAQRAESIVLREGATLASVLNRYPSQWVDGICAALGLPKSGKKGEKAKLISTHLRSSALAGIVQSLPEDSRAALDWMMEHGGSVGASALEREFETEIGLFWVERPPVSAVGRLRGSGLVVYGRVPGKGGRLYRSAMVPVELREAVSAALTKRR